MPDAYLIQADARRLPLRSGFVHFVMTSVPYFALRSYLDASDPLKPLEIGSEPTPELFIANQMVVFDEVRRVLRDDGVCVVNIGETWAAAGGSHGGRDDNQRGVGARRAHEQGGGDTGARVPPTGLKAGDMIGVPFLFAFAMRERGWYWRDTIIWRKPSAMPASLSGWRWQRCRVKVKKSTRAANGHKHAEANVKPQAARNGKDFINDTGWIDCPGCAKCEPNGGLVLRRGSLRSTAAHEYIFIFTKTASYYGDREGWATPAKSATLSRNKYTRIVDDPHEQFAVRHDHEFNGATANLRSVMTVGAEPMKHKHYAAYPSKLCAPFIKAFTSGRGVCPECGAPWARVVDVNYINPGNRSTNGPRSLRDREESCGFDVRLERKADTLGWRPTCVCPAAEPIPATVFDPFGGTMRTGVAALRAGRNFIGTELSAKYLHIGREQLANCLLPKEKRLRREPVASDPAWSLFAPAGTEVA